METKARPFNGTFPAPQPEGQEAADWFDRLPGSERWAAIYALAHERRLVNELLAALKEATGWIDGRGVVETRAASRFYDLIARASGVESPYAGKFGAGTDERGNAAEDEPIEWLRSQLEQVKKERDGVTAMLRGMAARRDELLAALQALKGPICEYAATGRFPSSVAASIVGEAIAKAEGRDSADVLRGLVAGEDVRAVLDMRGKLGAWDEFAFRVGRVRDGLTPPLSRHRTDGK